MPGRAFMRAACYLGILIVLAGISVAVAYLLIPAFRSFFQMEKPSSEKPTVVVVGGGLAGLSATIEATRHGAKVIIIEKEKSLGGNSAKATSGMNGVGTQAQETRGITDSVDLLVADTLKSGRSKSNPDLVSVLATNNGMAVEFLMSFGVELKDVVQLGGHSVPRTHRIPPTQDGKPIPVGFTIVSTLKKYVENDLANEVRVMTNSVFRGLIWNEGRVVGVKYRNVEGEEGQVHGNVVLTAGGFANDRTSSDSLLVKYAPQLSGLPTTNGVWATGDIIKATAKDGLSLVDMDQVQVHPTGFIEPSKPDADTKFLAPEALRGCGALLLDQSGRRFVNELGRRDQVTAAIFERCGHLHGDGKLPVAAVMLMNEQVIEKFGAPAAGFYKFKKLIEDVGSLDQVAAKLNVGIEVLREMIQKYQESAKSGHDEFEKSAFPTIFTENDHFLLSYVTPSLHYCMGGLEITSKAEVRKGNESKDPVPGLFAAGEVTGGVHGANRLGGNSLLECVVYGRIAGHHAAHLVHSDL